MLFLLDALLELLLEALADVFSLKESK